LQIAGKESFTLLMHHSLPNKQCQRTEGVSASEHNEQNEIAYTLLTTS